MPYVPVLCKEQENEEEGRKTYTKEYAPKLDPTAKVNTDPYKILSETTPSLALQCCKIPAHQLNPP